MKKHIFINLYWILDAVQMGRKPKMEDVAECFICVRDELMQPDTERASGRNDGDPLGFEVRDGNCSALRQMRGSSTRNWKVLAKF